jgi:sulfur-carrier protein adenylyltransferase/sulfurtransferase
MVKVRLPLALVSVTGLSGSEFTVAGDRVLDVLKNLCATHPELKAHFFNRADVLSDDPWTLFVNGEQAQADATVKSGDEIEIAAGMSGGAPAETSSVEFSPEEIRRYARHLTLPHIGRAGQARLKNGSVLIIGAGGLGSPIALYLSAAGIGRIGIADPDVVEESNLQRQILHDVTWLGRPKVDSARDRMQKINPGIEIVAVKSAVDESTAAALLADYDVVVDGSDNFNTRTIVNRTARRLGKPLVFGSVYQFEGHVSVFNAKPESPCYHCLFPKLPKGDLAPNCAAGGVIGVVPGIVGLFQANEVIKLILGIGEVLDGRVIVVDALAGRTRELRFKRRPDCGVCGAGRATATEDMASEAAISTPSLAPGDALSPSGLFSLLREPNPPILIDVREPGELEICMMANAINIPVARLAAKAPTLDPVKDYVVFCRSGARSARALVLLRSCGFERVRHLEGGLLRWARDVDSEMTIV